MLKTFVLIASLLFAGVADAAPQVFKQTTQCHNCVNGWVLNKSCCDCGDEDCEDCWFWGECGHCGVIRDNILILPIGTRRSGYGVLQDDYKFWRAKRLDGPESLNPSGWLVPSFKK